MLGEPEGHSLEDVRNTDDAKQGEDLNDALATVLQVRTLTRACPGGYGAFLGDQWRLDIHLLARR